MLAITNTEKFDEVVMKAKADAVAKSKHPEVAKRWLKAIDSAIELLETRSDFITWMDDSSLVIWSDSNEVYEANGTCGCSAAKYFQPCRHRALARIVRRYYEILAIENGEAVTIRLNQGQIAIVDAEDAERLLQFKWTIDPHFYKNRTNYYARRTINEDGKQKTVFLHREVLNAPQGLEVDHINGDGLDCRKTNLRLATKSQNQCNSHRGKVNKYGFRGIHKQVNEKFNARVKYLGKQIELGTFDTPEEAARAYDAKAKELHGEFATLNFPDNTEAIEVEKEEIRKDLFQSTYLKPTSTKPIEMCGRIRL